MTDYFDAHNHLQNCAGPAETAEALREAGAAGVKIMLCNGTAPDDWPKVRDLAAAGKGVFPCFGLHPWHIKKAGPLWLAELRGFLERTPSCVGEIGLDGAKGAEPALQEEVFAAQLKLAGKLGLPACLHCVNAWDRMLKTLKKNCKGPFMFHAYCGPAEAIREFAALGGYFSFTAALADPGRKKLHKALRATPRERLLFETEFPGARGGELCGGPKNLTEAISAAARILHIPAGNLAELSWTNGNDFLGKLAKI